jgi:3-oxoadipate enol-lactonase
MEAHHSGTRSYEMKEFEHRETRLRGGGSISFIELNAHSQEAVVLLHGLGTIGSSWQLQFESLASLGYRVLSPDLPGFGGSVFVGKRWSIRGCARLLVEWLDLIGLSQTCLAGISMGGVIALQLGLDYPERVKKLTLVNAFASLRPDRLDGWAYLVRRFTVASLRGSGQQAELVAKRVFPGAEQEILRRIVVQQIRETDPKVYQAAMLGLGLFDARRRLGTLTMPTLVISGMNDTTVPLISQAALAAGILDSKHVKIASAGHGVIIDQPEAFNAALADFLGPARAAA